MATNTAASLFDFADQLALISSEVLRYRLKKRHELSSKDRGDLENVEIELDRATALVRSRGIAALGALTKGAREEVEAATKAAEVLLRRVRKLERALQIATSVLTLALAAIAGKPQPIFSAIKGLKEATDADSE